MGPFLLDSVHGSRVGGTEGETRREDREFSVLLYMVCLFFCFPLADTVALNRVENEDLRQTSETETSHLAQTLHRSVGSVASVIGSQMMTRKSVSRIAVQGEDRNDRENDRRREKSAGRLDEQGEVEPERRKNRQTQNRCLMECSETVHSFCLASREHTRSQGCPMPDNN